MNVISFPSVPEQKVTTNSNFSFL